jgi:maltooligosyltrehalose trehalohydrolase
MTGPAPELHVGAKWQGEGVTLFRVWAPVHQAVAVAIEGAGGAAGRQVPMTPEPDGYFSARVSSTRPGTRYRYHLGTPDHRYPDPASRYQPEGPHGPSEVVDPSAFQWTDVSWPGLRLEGQVWYECHVGTLTEEGTWLAALRDLPRLAALGVTAIEMMPIAEFAGRHGWGYDGVNLFAPTHLYGTPDDLRRFVDGAHALGLGVILDVVYNHFGPDGNYLGQFSPAYVTARYTNEWGAAVNFDDEGSAHVREFVAANAAYWIDEFHMDGLRVDATQQMFDSSPVHVLADIVQRARGAAADRAILLIAENEPQDARLIRPAEQRGFGLDAMWNDDFHHEAVVALTGRREAYYLDYTATPQELISLVKWGFLYQGQRYSWQKARRGTPALDVPAARFVTFLENHDQVANTPSGMGERLHQRASPGMYRAITAYWLLAPGTPMFFQGQEFGATAPFLFFADHGGALGDAVRRGRAEFMRQFQGASTRPLVDVLPVPNAPDTFERCRLTQDARTGDARMVALHRDLLRIRREDPVFSASPVIDGAVIAERAFVLRYAVHRPCEATLAAAHETRLVVVNLGVDLHLPSCPEPIMAPDAGGHWGLLWSSEAPEYGGTGTATLDTEDGWHIPGQAAIALASRRI